MPLERSNSLFTYELNEVIGNNLEKANQKTSSYIFYLSRMTVEKVQDDILEVYECKYCHSSNITRFGVQSRKQRYYCKDCHKAFVLDSITRRMKFDPRIVTMTLDLYCKGVSLRGIHVPFTKPCLSIEYKSE